jgi:hypothetical protein
MLGLQNTTPTVCDTTRKKPVDRFAHLVKAHGKLLWIRIFLGQNSTLLKIKS